MKYFRLLTLLTTNMIIVQGCW